MSAEMWKLATEHELSNSELVRLVTTLLGSVGKFIEKGEG